MASELVLLAIVLGVDAVDLGKQTAEVEWVVKADGFRNLLDLHIRAA